MQESSAAVLSGHGTARYWKLLLRHASATSAFTALPTARLQTTQSAVGLEACLSGLRLQAAPRCCSQHVRLLIALRRRRQL